jgi:hypothetical protein
MWCDCSHWLREQDTGQPVPIWNSIRPADTQTAATEWSRPVVEDLHQLTRSATHRQPEVICTDQQFHYPSLTGTRPGRKKHDDLGEQ